MSDGVRRTRYPLAWTRTSPDDSRMQNIFGTKHHTKTRIVPDARRCLESCHYPSSSVACGARNNISAFQELVNKRQKSLGPSASPKPEQAGVSVRRCSDKEISSSMDQNESRRHTAMQTDIGFHNLHTSNIARPLAKNTSAFQ